MIRILVYVLLLGSWAETVRGNEMTRCCNEGERHFNSRNTCTGLRSTGSNVCKRSNSICCLRAMLDSQCEEGEKSASNRGTCNGNLNRVGGGIFKECCDCCLLAKEILSKGEPCVPPNTFSEVCRQTFNRCCSGAGRFSFTYAVATQTDLPRNGGSNRCAQNPCDHLCQDFGGTRVQCSCRTGYDLAEDGVTCRDVDECSLARSERPLCGDRELCVNEVGSFRCIISDNFTFHHCGLGYRLGTNGSCEDINECRENPRVCREETQICMNSPGSFDCHCKNGFTWSSQSDSCVDVDECLLLIDNCLTSQQCINTPGSYRCVRTLSCGTGYHLDSQGGTCLDIDECKMGTHNCGRSYNCRNTHGSFRCEPKVCGAGEILDPTTGDCTAINCPVGFRPTTDGQCEDVNECAVARRCPPFQDCVNTPGSYRCEEQPNYCSEGYKIDGVTGACIDIDECATGADTCTEEQTCVNTDGGFKCKCPTGYGFNEDSGECEDVDECNRFGGQVCHFHATCENVPGSYICHCKEGFSLASDGQTCEDVDECLTGHRCQQRCINIPGSFQCICDRGYTLSVDGTTCEDIDECSLWSGAGEDLCMGGCINTPGSYSCRCPSGYEMQDDGRTCRDVNECKRGECQGSDKICVNTLGGYRCHTINCPDNYVRDPKFKNRCNRPWPLCVTGDKVCLQSPISISHQYIALPRLSDFPPGSAAVPLFTMKGPKFITTKVQFELNLIDAVPEAPGVGLATRNSFLLQKGKDHNSAIIALREPLDGPQRIGLRLLMRVHHSGIFGGKAVAKLMVLVQDGFYCKKRCHPTDVLCIANHTLSISYQYAALPSMKRVPEPLEVTRVRAESLDGREFYVDYVMDSANRDKFGVKQEKNIGIVQLRGPIRGPKAEVIRLHMNVYSRNRVMIGHNLALIRVYVSEYYF